VVPRDRLIETVVAAEAKRADEQHQMDAIRAGRWDRSWIQQHAEVTYH
jgi:hypothetical protein